MRRLIELCRRSPLATVVSIAIVAGTLSGLLASAIFEISFTSYGNRLLEETRPPRLGESRTPTAPSQYLDALTAVSEKTSRSILPLYRAANQVTPVGVGAVLSDDGWLLVPNTFFAVRDAKQYVARYGDRVLAVERAVSDPVLPVMYVKLASSGMQAIPFGTTSNLILGEWVFGADVGAVFSSTASGFLGELPAFDAAARTSRVKTFPTLPDSLMVLNRSGSLLGVSEREGRVIPIEYISPTVRNLLRGETLDANP